VTWHRDFGLAWRLVRGRSGRLLLLVLCLAIGVAARVAVGTVSGRLADTLARESGNLLGADIEIAGGLDALDAGENADLDRLLPPGSRRVASARLPGMASSSDRARARPVEVHAVSPGFPLRGAVRVETAAGELGSAAVDALFAGPVVFVQPQLLADLGVAVGGRLRLGDGEFTVAGTLIEEPGLAASPFAIGPRLLVAGDRIAAAGLAAQGTRIRQRTLIALPDAQRADAVAAQLRRHWHLPGVEPAGAVENAPERDAPTDQRRRTVRTAAQTQFGLGTVVERVASDLQLSALIALLLGAVGVGSLVRSHVARQLDTVAVLQVLGATPGRVARLFALHCLGAALIAGVLAGVLGSLLAHVGLLALAGVLPVVVEAGVHPAAIAAGLLLALAATAVFAALPLIELRGLSPLAVLRGEPPGRAARLPWLAVALAGLVVFAALAAWDTRSWIIGPAVVGALALASAACAGLALVCGRLLAALPLPAAAVGLRLALRNLARPGLRPVAAVVALALATLLVTTQAVIQASLDRELDTGRGGQPGLFLIDIQDDQREAVRALVAGVAGAQADPHLSPLVLARWRGQAGSGRAPVTSDRVIRDREMRVSWRETPSADEEIVAGRWMAHDPARHEASLEVLFAQRFGLRLGDSVAFAVQGEIIVAEVTSLRRVRWVGFQPNFVILLSRPALEGQARSWIGTVPILEAGARTRLMALLAIELPNVTAIDVGEVVRRGVAFVDAIAVAVRFLGWCGLGAGFAVLLAMAVSTARDRRLDAAIVRAVGGRDRTLLTALAGEFAALSVIALVFALPLANALAATLLIGVLDLSLTVPWATLAALAGGVVAASVFAGVAANWTVLRSPPLAVLRDE